MSKAVEVEYCKVWHCRGCSATYNKRVMSQQEFEEHLNADNDPDISVEDSVETIHVYGVCPDCTSDDYSTDSEV